jgi:dinuclear metal center YbgI/SA1388 family protein
MPATCQPVGFRTREVESHVMPLLLADILSVLERMAPPSLAEAWDNVGLQIGDPHQRVDSVWVALDPGPEVVAAACRCRADLLITHHPLFFRPIQRIEINTPIGTVVEQAVRHRLAIYCMHTNLDAAADGLNDLLARRLGLRRLRPLRPPVDITGQRHPGIGRIGTLVRATRLSDLAQLVKQRLGAGAVRMAGDPALRVKHVALVAGSGGSAVGEFLRAEADAFISGDLRYHEVRDIEYARRGVVDVGHFHSEHLMADAIAQRLRRAFGPRRPPVRVQACSLEKDPFSVV